MHPKHNNQGVCRVRQPDVRTDVITTLCSPACVSWHRVLLLDVRSLNSLPLNPSHCLLQSLDEGLGVECEAMWEDEWKHNITIISDPPLKHHDRDWVFGFPHH